MNNELLTTMNFAYKYYFSGCYAKRMSPPCCSSFVLLGRDPHLHERFKFGCHSRVWLSFPLLSVIPAKAGNQFCLNYNLMVLLFDYFLDPRLRGNDKTEIRNDNEENLYGHAKPLLAYTNRYMLNYNF